MIINQTSFLGGLSARYNELRADPNTYQLLINGRVRDNSVSAIFSPAQDIYAPAGLYQNLTAVGSVLILFVGGGAWYRDVSTGETAWNYVAGVAMNPTVDTIDTVDIPASTLNFKRAGNLEDVKFNNSPARATAEGILATDGVTQPVILYPELGGTISGRPTFSYEDWTETEDGSLREYVPIGRFPQFIGRKLFMAIKGSAGKLNRLAHSVTGRPLDFVVAITNTTGNKDGDALSTAHSVGYDEITGIFKAGTENTVIVTTGRATTGVALDYNNTLFFGEPNMRNADLFPVGVLNPNCAVDVNGDSAFISPTGIHSFNSTMQTKIESNNDPISVQIYRLLADAQTYGAAIDFDDYALFAVETIYGPGVVVLDKTIGEKGVFVGLDLYRGIGRIKQFAKVHTPSGQRLFFITQDNRLFEFGAASTRETCRLYIGDWNGGLGGLQQIFRRASWVFADVHETGPTQITCFVDRVIKETGAYTLQAGVKSNAPTWAIPYPVTRGPGTNCVVAHQWQNPEAGFSTGVMIEWASDAKLVYVTYEVDTQTSVATNTASIVGVKAEPAEFQILGNSFPGSFKLRGTVISAGNFLSTTTGYDDYDMQHVDEIFGVAGNTDLQVAAEFYNKVTPGARYYSIVRGDCEFFFYNVGWTTANIGTATGDPDGFQLGSLQANWLKGQLSMSTAKFKIVVLAWPPYADVGYSMLRLPFRAWGASLVLNSGPHNYQRYIIDGLNYITCGCGNAIDPVGTAQSGYQNSRSALGYVRVQTNAFSLRTAHIRFDGDVYDEFTIYP